MKTIFLTLLISCLSIFVFAQNNYKKIQISKDLELIQISENAYTHLSYTESSQFGRYPSNGMVLIENGQAFLFDTPTSDSLTMVLISYLQDILKLKIVGFITNDWHIDSMGGLAAIDSLGIPSYSNEMTRQIAKSKGLPIPKNGFNVSLKLKLGKKEIDCYYLGAAHTMDNIVVWLPSEKILFADCMIKETKAKNLGFTGDGDVKAYLSTVKKVKEKFPKAKIVVPGHGDFGGIELIDHTIELAK
jgi:metallo-beta-lactamase class B